MRAACPQRLPTGLAGALCVALGSVLLTLFRALVHPASPNRAAYVGLLAVTCGVMGFCELGVFRAHRRQFDFSRMRRIGRRGHADVARRLGALLATLVGAWGLYAVLGEYGLYFSGWLSPRFEQSWYAPFFRFFAAMSVALPLLAVPYFYLCEGFRRWPREEDELLHLWDGYRAMARLRRPSAAACGAMRALAVKLFFVPVMTVFFVANAQAFETTFLRFLAGPWVWNEVFAGRLFAAVYEGLYLIDVNLALLGYVCCCRLLDTHVRSAEPTVLGWAVALACYPPFNMRLLGLYLPHDPSGQSWTRTLAGMPGLYGAVGAAILLLVGIYLYGTIAFGFRFSNLTHRGIVCRGPYAWVRHPAYAAKNLSWWLIGLPFLTSPAACLRLVLLNALYVARALTEERHLSRDPVYREYMKRVRYRFIPGVV